jgi:peptidoglycan/xylan/chitin deacetylase (PgdA/CDA1 family)
MVSLTFDDGLPCHYNKVFHELNQREMKATFFVPIIPRDGASERVFDVRFRDEEWIKAISERHEIGVHSVHHRGLVDTPTGEMVEARDLLHAVLGVQPRSMAWVQCQTNAEHKAVAAKYFDQARGVERIGDDGDRFDYPSICVGDWNIDFLTGEPGVYMFHGVDQPGSWGNVSKDQFLRFLDKIQHSVTFAEYMKEKP